VREESDMGKSELQPEQVVQCRQGLRLSQPKFGERIGVGRVSVYQYEHGRRHDSQRIVTISQTVNMACGAAWLGIDGYTDILDAESRAGVPADGKLPKLPDNTIDQWLKEAAVAELQKRGFAMQMDHVLVFPLITILAVWSRLQHHYTGLEEQMPKFHPLISASVPAVAVLEFASPHHAFDFKMRFVGGESG
jgi:transcriptional regulator with XRE-family HTH domain